MARAGNPSKGLKMKSKTIPESEQWLHKNPQSLASVKQGLKESAEGKGIYLGSFAKYAHEGE
jgi:hypothetical protein